MADAPSLHNILERHREAKKREDNQTKGDASGNGKMANHNEKNIKHDLLSPNYAFIEVRKRPDIKGTCPAKEGNDENASNGLELEKNFRIRRMPLDPDPGFLYAKRACNYRQSSASQAGAENGSDYVKEMISEQIKALRHEISELRCDINEISGKLDEMMNLINSRPSDEPENDVTGDINRINWDKIEIPKMPGTPVSAGILVKTEHEEDNVARATSCDFNNKGLGAIDNSTMADRTEIDIRPFGEPDSRKDRKEKTGLFRSFLRKKTKDDEKPFSKESKHSAVNDNTGNASGTIYYDTIDYDNLESEIRKRVDDAKAFIAARDYPAAKGIIAGIKGLVEVPGLKKEFRYSAYHMISDLCTEIDMIDVQG